MVVPAIPGTEPEPLGEGAFQARAVREGKKAKDLARSVLEDAGFDRITADVKFAPLGVEVNFMAVDGRDEPWQFDVSGAFTNSGRPGLRRTDTLWKALGKATVLQQARREQRGDDTSAELILLTTHKPGERSAGAKALDGVVGPGKPIRDVIGMLDDDDLRRLAAFGRGERPE